MGGMPFDVYTKLYDTMVWSTISYGAAVWGTSEFSCIYAVHHRACRFFLAVGKYASNTAVTGDMGWLPPIARQWKSVLSHWFRLNRMNKDRLNYKIYKGTFSRRRSTNNWCHRVSNKVSLDIDTITDYRHLIGWHI